MSAGALPDQVRIGPVSYRVEVGDLEDDSDDEALGRTRHRVATIRIDERTADDQRRVVLLHELIHCAWHLAGLDATGNPAAEAEEVAVAGLSAMLLDALDRSPELRAYLWP